jgi:sugar/nucleoside kinase (ribokinase family)
MPVDVCGAGDAFLAGIVYGFLTDEVNMIEHGIVNAGISVQHMGTYAPNLEELKQGLNEYYQQCRDS